MTTSHPAGGESGPVANERAVQGTCAEIAGRYRDHTSLPAPAARTCPTTRRSRAQRPALNDQGYYVWTHFIGGHLGRLGTRDDVTVHQQYMADIAAASVIEKYTGVLAAADVFTESTTFWVMHSIRLDLGYGFDVHP